MPSVSMTPLTEHTGAEIVGLDFTAPIDSDNVATLRRAFVDRHVLVMRGQQFDPAQFKAAVQLFGELHPHDKKERHVPGHPGVDYVSNDQIENGRRIIPGETFHTDHSNHPRPASTRWCACTPRTAARRCSSTRCAWNPSSAWRTRRRWR